MIFIGTTIVLGFYFVIATLLDILSELKEIKKSRLLTGGENE